MIEEYEDPLAKLEAVLLDWDDRVSESRQRTTSRLQSVKACLEVAWTRADTVRAKSANARQESSFAPDAEKLEAECARLTASLEQSQQHVKSLERSLERAYAQIQELERHRTSLLLEKEELKPSKSKLVSERDALHGQVASRETSTHATRDTRIPDESAGDREVAAALEIQRLHAQLLQLQAEHTHNQSELNRRLSDALRDRDEAHRQIVALRANAEATRVPANVAGDRWSSHTGSDDFALFESEGSALTRLRIGQLLERTGHVTPHQLETALEAKKKTPQKPLGAILIDMGYTDEATIAKVLASQLNLPYVELDRRAIDPAAAALIPAKLARHHTCIPLSIERGQLVVAMANPLDLIALEDLEIATRRRVDPVIATPSAIDSAIAQHYTAI